MQKRTLKLSNYLSTLAREKGVVSSSGKYIEIYKIVSMLSEYWADLTYTDFLEPGIPFELKYFSYMGRILRNKTHEYAHPLKHILLACWLADGDVNNLITASKTSTIDSGNLINRNLENKQQVERTVLKLLREGLSFNAIETKTNKSHCYIRRLAGINRIQYSSNSTAFSDSIKRKVLIKALYGIHREMIAKQLNLSIGYVEQVICCEPNMSKWRKNLRIRKSIVAAYTELESIRKEHPSWNRTQIRKHAQNAYFVLYNNDKNLIEKVMPKKIKPVGPLKDWAVEDERILQKIKGLADLSSKSLTEIGRLVNDHDYLRRKIERLPKCQQFLIRVGKLKQ